MTALMLIVVALFGGLCWAGRRPRQNCSDQYISADDVDAVGGDICCDDSCDDSCASDDYQSDRDD